MKRGQAANEAAMIIGIMTLFLIVFIAVISGELIDASKRRNWELVEGVADVIASELSLASSSEDGYARTFTLPPAIGGVSYAPSLSRPSEANFTQIYVAANISGSIYNATRILPGNIEGSLGIGDNLIVRNFGTVNVTAPDVS